MSVNSKLPRSVSSELWSNIAFCDGSSITVVYCIFSGLKSTSLITQKTTDALQVALYEWKWVFIFSGLEGQKFCEKYEEQYQTIILGMPLLF